MEIPITKKGCHQIIVRMAFLPQSLIPKKKKKVVSQGELGLFRQCHISLPGYSVRLERSSNRYHGDRVELAQALFLMNYMLIPTEKQDGEVLP